MEAAVIIAGRTGLINPLAAEGRDILPVLEYSMNRMRLQLCDAKLEKEFLAGLYVRAAIVSKSSKGLFYNLREKPVRLSERQLNTLRLLALNMTYEQISVETGVKITTVRDHVSRLYEKLGVNNSRDALVRGRELEFI